MNKKAMEWQVLMILIILIAFLIFGLFFIDNIRETIYKFIGELFS